MSSRAPSPPPITVVPPLPPSSKRVPVYAERAREGWSPLTEALKSYLALCVKKAKCRRLPPHPHSVVLQGPYRRHCCSLRPKIKGRISVNRAIDVHGWWRNHASFYRISTPGEWNREESELWAEGMLVHQESPSLFLPSHIWGHGADSRFEMWLCRILLILVDISSLPHARLQNVFPTLMSVAWFLFGISFEFGADGPDVVVSIRKSDSSFSNLVYRTDCVWQSPSCCPVTMR